MDLEDIPKIEWPEEWDPKEGWPSDKSEKVRGDGRTWSRFAQALSMSLPDLKKALGAEVTNRSRTIEGAKDAIRAYYDEHGKRPSAISSKEMMCWDTWLRKRDTSFAKLCNEMGLLHLPKGPRRKVS